MYGSVTARQKEPAEEERKMMSEIGAMIAGRFGLIQKEHDGAQKLCYLRDKGATFHGRDEELLVKVEIKSTMSHMQVTIHDGSIIDEADGLLKENGVSFVDHGMFLHIITPWQPGKFKGLEFPEIKMATQNFGPIKMIVGTTDALTTKGEPIADFHLLFDLMPVVRVTVCPGKKWVNEVYLASATKAKALCDTLDFPFREFVLRELETYEFDSEDLNRIGKARSEIKAQQLSLGRRDADSSRDWEMDDPRKHDPKKFRYLVHSLSAHRWAQEFESPELKQERFEAYSGNPLQQPGLFVKQTYISCSVIDQDHPTTWSGAGLILGVPAENIRSAFHHDTYTFVKSDGADDYDDNLPSAAKILSESNRDVWNEIVISGTKEKTGSAIRIVGGFCSKRPDTGELSASEMAERVEKFCAANDLPFITLRESENKRIPVPGWASD